jgi:hypothetical protein
VKHYDHHESYANTEIPQTIDNLILSALIFIPFINILILAYTIQVLRVSLYDEDPPNLKGALFFGVYGLKIAILAFICVVLPKNTVMRMLYGPLKSYLIPLTLIRSFLQHNRWLRTVEYSTSPVNRRQDKLIMDYFDGCINLEDECERILIET